MISTFDLTLLGTLVSAGGILFLRQGKWPYVKSRSLMWIRPSGLTLESCEQHERSTAIAGVRWLTVGVLGLFLAYTHSAGEGYLFGPWTDIMFHVILVAGCWRLTAFRIKQAAEQSTAVAHSETSTSRTS
jgi:hypothetical protein